MCLIMFDFCCLLSPITVPLFDVGFEKFLFVSFAVIHSKKYDE